MELISYILCPLIILLKNKSYIRDINFPEFFFLSQELEFLGTQWSLDGYLHSAVTDSKKNYGGLCVELRTSAAAATSELYRRKPVLTYAISGNIVGGFGEKVAIYWSRLPTA